jgi:hypothetical protein
LVGCEFAGQVKHYVKITFSSYAAVRTACSISISQDPFSLVLIFCTAILRTKMRSLTVASLLLVVGLCRAQQLAGYVQFEGNRSSPKSVSRQARDALEQADNSPDASHSVSFSSPGYGDWNWTLQLSDVSVPTLSNSTPDAHVAFTTWHFSRVGEQPSRAYRPEEPPFCAYPMDVNFPYNVSSQWDQNNSSCVPALGEECASALARVTMSSDCDSKNVDILQVIGENACAGMLSGGPAESHGIGKYGYGTSSQDDTCCPLLLLTLPLFCSVR